VDDPDLSIEALFDEERLLVAPAGHPLYDRQSVTLADLAEHELLLEASGTSFRDELDSQAAAQGIELKAQAEVDGMRLLASLAFSGFGAAILPASAAPGWVGGDWRRVPIVGLQGRSVGLARRRRGLPSAAERAVADVIGIVVRDGAADQPGLHVATRPGGPAGA
jgi:LysR family hydrogen peroxide-inducible transcriptional activator